MLGLLSLDYFQSTCKNLDLLTTLRDHLMIIAIGIRWIFILHSWYEQSLCDGLSEICYFFNIHNLRIAEVYSPDPYWETRMYQETLLLLLYYSLSSPSRRLQNFKYFQLSFRHHCLLTISCLCRAEIVR